jgi:hypothetical protein
MGRARSSEKARTWGGFFFRSVFGGSDSGDNVIVDKGFEDGADFVWGVGDSGLASGVDNVVVIGFYHLHLIYENDLHVSISFQF